MRYLLVFFLLLVNIYILYFNSSPETLVLFSIITIIICWIFFSSSVTTNVNLFLSLIILFPTKAISPEYTNQFASDFIVEAGLDTISYFEVYLLPLMSVMLFLKYLSLNRKWDMKFVMGIAFVICFYIGYVLFIFYGENQAPINRSLAHIWITLLYSSQIFAIPALLGFRNEFLNHLKTFESSIILMNIVLIVELTLAANLLLPQQILSQNFDWRDGFRSIFFGYSTTVGFFGFLGTFVSLIRIFRDKKYRFIFLLIGCFGIQFATFDRTPIVASLIACTFILLYRLKGNFLIVAGASALIVVSYYPIISDSLVESTFAKQKDGGIFSANSSFDRFYIQFRYVDGAVNNLFLPAGRKTHSNVFDKEVVRNFPSNNNEYMNISSIGMTEAHNIWVQMLFDLGLICFIIYLLIVISIYKENLQSLNIYYVVGFLAISSYYLSQATPVYFFFPLLFSIFSTTSRPVNKGGF